MNDLCTSFFEMYRIDRHNVRRSNKIAEKAKCKRDLEKLEDRDDDGTMYNFVSDDSVCC